MSLSDSTKRFFIEKLIPAITGGYTYYSDQPLFIFWIHTLIFSWSFFIPLVLVNLQGMESLALAHPMITLILWFIIKLINFQIHSDFNKQDQNANELNAIPIPNGDEEEDAPPFGISPDIWRIRDRLTDFSEFSIDFIVDENIRQGYNPNELFHFFEIYQRGELADYSMDTNRQSTFQVVVPTVIHICGCEFIVTWTRKDLERWFDRPYKLIEVVIAPLLAAVCGILCCLNTNFISSASKTVFVFSTASAQYSLLLAPNPDSSSTTLQDPFTPYSRSFHLILFQLVFSFLTYLAHVDWLSEASMIFFNSTVPVTFVIDFFADVFRIIVIVFPFLNMLGMIGSLKVSWFEAFEVLQLIFIGKSGSVTFYSANLSMLFDLLIVVGLAAFHTSTLEMKKVQNVLYSFCTFAGVFFASSNQFPFLSKFLGLEERDYYLDDYKKPWRMLLSTFIRALWSSIVVFLMLFFNFDNKLSFYIISGAFITVSLITHSLLPQMTCCYPFGKFSRPFFPQNKHYQRYMIIMTEIERAALVPFTIGNLITISGGKSFGLHQWVESLIKVTLIICVTANGYRAPIRFALSLALIDLAGQTDEYALFQMLVNLTFIWKIDEISKKLEFVTSYSSFHSLSNRWQVVVLFLMLANIQFTCFVILVSAAVNAPLIPIAGYPLFLPSYPRPTAFWFDPIKYEPKPGDALFYKDLSDSLASRFSNDVSSGIIPPLNENRFYLICDDYFNAIIHIISSGVGFIVFQVRGLEVREQTLCHRNELQIIRSELERIDEMRTFMISSLLGKFTSVLWVPVGKLFSLLNLPQPLPMKHRSFISSSCWITIHDDYRLEGYSVSANRVSSLFPDRSHQDMLYINLIRILTLVIKESDEIAVPDDFNYSLPVEIEEATKDWITLHDKERIKKEIMSIAKVMIDEMNKVSGDFEWKLYRYFSSTLMHLHDYLWIPSLVDEKLVHCFRTAISLAVFDVSDMLPDTNEELTDLIEEKMQNCTVMPESDQRWATLIKNKEPVLETIRQLQDDKEVAIKYMIFTRKEHSYKLIELNPELVKGIWAGQTYETIFMESTDRERASIQFDSFTLRNIISQSANSPVGYPELICPISFSYSYMI